ncbi:hypothetical protein SBRCBS47491_003770 [Sporothrix bragantina]|uniref:Uncharacterized protein n=1 Tax=Sporothrix bragantina TaxID=671064 RepID=A0ABP0BJE7_9PEZI
MSSQPMRATTTVQIPTSIPPPPVSQASATVTLKRPYSDGPSWDHANMTKRRQTSIAHDAHSPSLLRKESSLGDTLASPWTPAINRPGNRSQSRTPNLTRMSSGTPHDDLHDLPIQTHSPVNDIDEPPPRRELPKSITRHISQPSSQTEDSNSRSASESSKKAVVAEIEVQTEEPFVAPEEALFAGMGLFQELSTLKDKMIKECLNMTKLVGGSSSGSDEAEARLVARYAIEFQSRFVGICARHTGPYLT